MPGDLKTFKRRAAGHVERGVTHSDEGLACLFAPGSSFTDSLFNGCELDAAVLPNAALTNVQFSNCQMVGANFRGATLNDCVFFRCKLTGATFAEASLRNVTFEGCTLEGSSFFGARLMQPVAFATTSLRDADLRFYESEADAPSISSCDLRGVSLSMNCEFWNGTFDVAAVATFGRVLARASRDPELIEMVKARWGEKPYADLDAYMKRGS